ncbi:protease [Clostridia bacterium]|nr:protease [Clostridia bacterium]
MYDYEKYTSSDREREIYDTTAYSQTNEMSYNPNDEVVIQPKRKKRTGLKIVGLLCCFALVAGVSIEGYKFFDKNGFGYQEKSTSSEVTTTTKSKNDSSSLPAVVDAIKNGTTDNLNPSTLDDAEKALHITANARNNPLSAPEIYSKVIPSVVGIRSTFSVGQGTGTGIIMSNDGYIVTNAHVVLYSYTQGYSYFGGGREVQEQASEVTVLLSDENQTEYEAVIIGVDSESDLAVLKINEIGLTAAEFGDSDNLLVGEDVVAIGNPLGFDLFGTLTKGVISALNRDVTINDNNMTLIQTDTAINAGNSGGPLINCYGQIIGINSAKLSSNYTSSDASIEGLAFAIPITSAKKIIDDLLKYGYVTGKPKLGISCKDISDTYGSVYGKPVEGALVVSVEVNGSSDKAGIKVGDIITGVNGNKISNSTELTEQKNKYKAGDIITLHIIRNGSEVDVDVTLAENVSVALQ